GNAIRVVVAPRQRTDICRASPQPDLPIRVPQATRSHGHRRSPRRPEVAVATSLRRARDRFDPSRMFGSRHCLRGTIFAPYASFVFPLLPRLATALITGQGFAGSTYDSISRPSHYNSSRRWLAPPL